MARLLDLPSELVAHIVSLLPDADVLATRQTAHYIERASLSYFGKHFFRKKGFMITTPSLDVLQHIADHTELRKYVEHIWFNPDTFTFVTPECAPEEIYDDDGEYDNEGNGFRYKTEGLIERDRKRWEAYCACTEDHASLMNVQNLEIRLVAIMASLPKLEVIGMRRSEDHCPWGWKRVMNAVGEDPRILGRIPSWPLFGLSGPTRLFMALINAVAVTDVKLRRLYTDAIEIDNIRPDLLTQEKFDKACAGIVYLEINSSKAWLNHRMHADYITLHGTASSPPPYGEGLLRLLKATRHLKELGLQIFMDRKQRHMVPPASRNPESWRQSYPYICLELLTSNLSLQNLTRIKLEKLTTSPNTLLAFLTPCSPNLRSLKIRDTRLLSSPDCSRPWQPIFAHLSISCPSLEYILFYHLMYEHGGIYYADNPVSPLTPLEGPIQGEELFIKYDHIALEARGVAEVSEKLGGAVEGHWYNQPVFGYAMDEGVWHTDTEDEEW